MIVRTALVLLTVCLNSHSAPIFSITSGFFAKTQIPAGLECKDEFDQTRSHVDIWNATVGSCDKKACFHGQLHKYYVEFRCRAIEEPELPDPVNCERVGDLSREYPGCCPVLVCSTGVYPSTASTPVCKDIHAEVDCQKWNEIGACNSGSAMYSNFSLNINCAKTCGVCS